jgi:hypothetical protein
MKKLYYFYTIIKKQIKYKTWNLTNQTFKEKL